MREVDLVTLLEDCVLICRKSLLATSRMYVELQIGKVQYSNKHIELVLIHEKVKSSSKYKLVITIEHAEEMRGLSRGSEELIDIEERYLNHQGAKERFLRKIAALAMSTLVIKTLSYLEVARAGTLLARLSTKDQ